MYNILGALKLLFHFSHFVFYFLYLFVQFCPFLFSVVYLLEHWMLSFGRQRWTGHCFFVCLCICLCNVQCTMYSFVFVSTIIWQTELDRSLRTPSLIDETVRSLPPQIVHLSTESRHAQFIGKRTLCKTWNWQRFWLISSCYHSWVCWFIRML